MMHEAGMDSGLSGSVTGALSVDGAQPAWMTLDSARERAFTGEIVFELDPEVSAYLDHGVVYYAERADGTSLGRRLLDSGLVDHVQLERGTVRVGDIEHLGRLFDRDPSVDRDAVVVMTETSTEDLITELANRAVTSVRVTAYRHHPSGVHRWFVAPVDPATHVRPVATETHVDATVIDEPRGLPIASSGHSGDELTIEWDEPIDGFRGMDPLPVLGDFDATLLGSMFDDRDRLEMGADAFEPTTEIAGIEAMSLDMSLFSRDADDGADGDGDGMVTADPGSEPDLELDLSIDDFQIVWPDGTQDVADGTPDDAAAEATPLDVATTVEPFVQIDDGVLHFEMPPLTLSDEPAAADASVPDDVAAAVRRALAAIESATVESLPAESLHVEPLQAEPLRVEPRQVDEADAEPARPAPPAPRAGNAFAPPSLSTRAEVVYAQMEAAASEAVAEPSVDSVGSAPASGVASVVFVDDDEGSGDDSNERSSALRRLIGSLRRKDH
jgi:hypothetical protein